MRETVACAIYAQLYEFLTFKFGARPRDWDQEMIVFESYERISNQHKKL